MSGKHSIPPRGLEFGASPAAAKLNFQGLFGRMFPDLPAAKYGNDSITKLTKLAAKMISGFDAPKDGKDEEESGIPALYTYLGQFIDHDITFDPASSLQKQNDPNALTDFRSPALDLDNVYGRGPDDAPFMYDEKGAFLLGTRITGGDPMATDLPRDSGPRQRAIIGDPRNDENSIVSQLQGLFLRFHNRTLAENPKDIFQDIQKRVRFHYQYVVVNDFLPRIVDSSVLNALKTKGRYDAAKLKFFKPKDPPFMPIEFSAAAYRLGHSMVRPGYRLNDFILLPIFPVAKIPAGNPPLPEGLTGFRKLISNWGIDWGRFIDVDTRVYNGSVVDNFRRLQFAYRIDTSLVFPLGNLPVSVANTKPFSLALRNLERGFSLGLPNGQEVARAMGEPVLDDKHILIGKGVDKPAADEKPVPISDIDPIFEGNCPLWTYVLAEAMQHKTTVEIPVTGKVPITTPRLGPVGGRIVAEVFLALMFSDKSSFLTLDPNWHPKDPKYALKDFVKFALGE